MSDLLTSLDIVNQAFKKTMRGYDPAEVDEFLDRVAESIQIYAQKLKDYERTMGEQSDKLQDYENLKGSLQEALLMAQKTAEERIRNATAMADNIVSEAKAKAEAIVKDAENNIVEFANELDTLQQLRKASFSGIRSFLDEVSDVVNKAESGSKMELPNFTRELVRRNTTAKAEHTPPADIPEARADSKRMDLSDTLNALGLDPSLLPSNTEM